jgi:hypothetical protein
MILIEAKEPVFAAAEKRKGKYTVYFDVEGFPCCCNFAMSPNYRKCFICGNNCVQFMVDDKDGTYICSGCGKFPRELLLT